MYLTDALLIQIISLDFIILVYLFYCGWRKNWKFLKLWTFSALIASLFPIYQLVFFCPFLPKNAGFFTDVPKLCHNSYSLITVAAILIVGILSGIVFKLKKNTKNIIN